MAANFVTLEQLLKKDWIKLTPFERRIVADLRNGMDAFAEMNDRRVTIGMIVSLASIGTQESKVVGLCEDAFVAACFFHGRNNNVIDKAKLADIMKFTKLKLHPATENVAWELLLKTARTYGVKLSKSARKMAEYANESVLVTMADKLVDRGIKTMKEKGKTQWKGRRKSSGLPHQRRPIPVKPHGIAPPTRPRRR